jgi:spore maturation protein SpmB
MRRRPAQTGFRQGVFKGFDITRVIGKPQVVVAAERQQWLAIGGQLRLLGTGHQPAMAVQTVPLSLFYFGGKITHENQNQNLSAATAKSG